MTMSAASTVDGSRLGDRYPELAAASRARPALVVGLGRTGLSCVRHLSALGVPVAVCDSRREPPALERLAAEFPAVPVHLGGFPEGVLARAAALVVSPGVSPREPALAVAAARGQPVIGDIELFARAARAPVLAVTGTNGKSTVTTLVARMIEAAGRAVRAGGNLGPEALALLEDEPPELYVLEVSSFQLETTCSLEPLAAAVLNVSPDHLDRHASLVEYAAAKRRVFRGSGTMVLNADDPLVAAMREPGRRVLEFTLGPAGEGRFGLVEADGHEWLAVGARRYLPARELGLRGRHNVANALAALALGTAVGLAPERMVEALASFRGLAHRCELVAMKGGVRWYNDSKATNVGAAVAAIDGLAPEGPLVLIAGGEGKGQDFRALAQALPGKVRAVVLVGRDADRLERAIAGRVAVRRAGGMREAVRTAGALARPGDAVLLAPACASFDLYESYEHRGRDFAAAVGEVIG